jgi:hypothetical protein
LVSWLVDDSEKKPPWMMSFIFRFLETAAPTETPFGL